MARTMTAAALTDSLDRHFAGVTTRRARKGLPAPQVLVRAPGFEYTSGARALPFHAASVGKLATAALVMQEVEAGRLALTSAVDTLLPEAEVRGPGNDARAAPRSHVGHAGLLRRQGLDRPEVHRPRHTRARPPLGTGRPPRLQPRPTEAGR